MSHEQAKEARRDWWSADVLFDPIYIYIRPAPVAVVIDTGSDGVFRNLATGHTGVTGYCTHGALFSPMHRPLARKRVPMLGGATGGV